MVKGSLFLIVILAVSPALICAEDPVNFSIRYFDKRIYHAALPGGGASGDASGGTYGGAYGEPILVQATITNNGPAPYRFKLANDRAFSIDFDIRTLSNRAVEAADSLVRRRTASGTVFFREISVESGESFSFVEDLRDYADLKDPGAFVVSARVYPELVQADSDETGRVLESNRLSLSLRPPALPGSPPPALNTDTGEILSRERLAPDEVLEYLLGARQKGQWEKFFLYLDLEEILTRDPVRRRQWNAESEEGRRRMLERYREELRQSVIDGDISAIPVEFEVERTNYNALEGTVTVLEKFRTGTNYTERKRYTYYLKRKDGYWAVVDYTVSNLGTE
ncbi:MAG: hypothetical protein LBO76_00915 [Treponema sp.]|jgi:hypothetical protein|nr:hypothetical protein [Treponema sp.]